MRIWPGRWWGEGFGAATSIKMNVQDKNITQLILREVQSLHIGTITGKQNHCET
jgi:hypothetical protein